MQTALSNILLVIFPLCVAYGAISDIASMTISNRLIALMVFGFVLLAAFSGMDFHTFGVHWLAAIVVLAIGFACFSLGWMGGGDAKFGSAIVLWLGPANAIDFLLAACIFGGLLTVALLSFRLLPASALRQGWALRLHNPKAGVPYGVALAAAALFVYPKAAWLGMAG